MLIPYKVVLALGALIALCCSCVNVQQDALDSSVKVFSVNMGGSGVIDGDRIITCNHVVGTRTSVLVQTSSSRKILEYDVDQTSRATDLAILVPRINSYTKSFPSKEELEYADVEVGDKVFCYSNPHGELFTYSEGYVMKRRFKSRGLVFILMDITVAHGSSGAGVFNSETGELVGIVSAIIPCTSMTAVIPAKLIP
jgi:hypothetical protein